MNKIIKNLKQRIEILTEELKNNSQIDVQILLEDELKRYNRLLNDLERQGKSEKYNNNLLARVQLWKIGIEDSLKENKEVSLDVIENYNNSVHNYDLFTQIQTSI